MLRTIIRHFNRHPQSVNESYWQHARYALKVSLYMLWTSLNLAWHAIFPFSRISYARDRILVMADTLLKRNPTSFLFSPLNDISETIHHTPLIRLRNLSKDSSINVYAKCEMFAPSLSIKDRIVLQMIKSYEKSGELKTGGTIIEASSGNTGCSIAMLAACFGYNSIITVPAKTSSEKIAMMKAFGANVFISPANVTIDSPEHYVNKAKHIKECTPNSVLLNQYENHINPQTHYHHTADEIWQALGGNIDYVIVCSSSGGTISGIGKYFKEKNSKIKIIMPDPVGSIYYDFFIYRSFNPSKYRPYKLEGIGKEYICGTIDFSVIDDVVTVSDHDAFFEAKCLAKTEGIFVGGSSGAALHVAGLYVKKLRKEGRSANIVVVFPDSGFKYLSTFYKEGHIEHHT